MTPLSLQRKFFWESSMSFILQCWVRKGKLNQVKSPETLAHISATGAGDRTTPDRFRVTKMTRLSFCQPVTPKKVIRILLKYYKYMYVYMYALKYIYQHSFLSAKHSPLLKCIHFPVLWGWRALEFLKEHLREESDKEN